MEGTEQQTGNLWQRLENNEFDRFGIISFGFLIIGIVGGITVGVFVKDAIWQIGVIAAFTMLSLSMMLAVQPMKWIMRTMALAIIVDLIFILVNLF
ncbi:MAG: hypothetical protein HN542_01145 [Flavobacteriales bacterium]|jgi:hypothetical protein|nr:hypothetical protein [Flavobacteriales bacterium]NCG30915.1 hypothetical protein [Bacteroidota bacterium]MBT3964392.1 hypothetical protein [Flavobacteriales bacterium]MBT4705832.1 hypothetical protein [Flavobacteriales bacterium]MBT4931604.1 hypothetical protein [Flavobacteriales bacterium]